MIGIYKEAMNVCENFKSQDIVKNNALQFGCDIKRTTALELATYLLYLSMIWLAYAVLTFVEKI